MKKIKLGRLATIKLKTLALAAALIILPALTVKCAQAEWTEADTVWQATYHVVHFIDWRQTRTIAKNPDRYYEKNELLGEHPTVTEVDQYFLITGLGHFAIARMLPPNYRRAWQVVLIVEHGRVVGENYQLGIRMDF